MTSHNQIELDAALNTGDESPKSARTPSRAITAVATTLGAAALVTTAFAAPADASSKYTVWNHVANCESSGNWHIDTGNGFYGGLQFSSSTWRAYGGHKYAGHADNATRMEQIQVARRVLDAQGPGAWPVCGANAGLSRHNGHATSKKLPRDAGGSSRHATKASHKHRSHKHRHHKHHARKIYRVHSGDTLSSIARKFHVHGGWHKLFKLNRSHISNPNNLHVGQKLVVR